MKYLIIGLFLLCSCSKEQPSLKVIATPIPHTEMLQEIQADLKAQGVNLEIITVEDFQIPNSALVDRECDANFFQHSLFLNDQIEQFHYPLESASLIHIEPMGAYSKKIKTLAELKNKGIVAIPSDPSNQARALLLLQEEGLITLKPNASITPLNILSNPKQLNFYEVDAALLSRTLEDVDLALITTNFALQAGLSPLESALFIEKSNPLYINILVVRLGEKNREDIQKLLQALKSEKMKQFIEKKYKGSVLIVDTI